MIQTTRNGKINDCGCLLHNGPHWLHADKLYRAANRALLDKGYIQGFLVEEIARLRQKEYTGRAEGMSDTETIAEFLARTGWPAVVIAECCPESAATENAA